MSRLKKKSLLYITDTFPPEHQGGAGIMANQLATYPWKDYKVTVITSTLKFKKEKTEKYKWGTVIRIPSMPYTHRQRFFRTLWMNKQARRAFEIILNLKPDIIHAHNVHQYFSFALFPEIRRIFPEIKLFMTAHDAMTISYGKVALVDRKKGKDTPRKIRWREILQSAGFSYIPFRNIIIKKQVKALTKLIVVSKSLESYLKANGLANTLVINNGIQKKPSKPKLPKKLKQIKDKDSSWIIYSGRTSGQKGVFRLLEAFEQIHDRFPKSKVLIIGKPSKVLKSYLNKHRSIKNKVLVTGWLPHDLAFHLLSYGSVCVVPSLYIDPFPTTVLEAASQNCPLLVTCFGGAKEAVKNKVHGFVINPYDTNEFQKQLAQLLKDPKQAKSFSNKAYKRWQSHFSLDTFISKHKSLYENTP